MPDIAPYLAQLEALADQSQADALAAYHKAPRRYLGIRVPVVTELAKTWRQDLTLDDRVALAAALWDTNIHEARVAAAKLLTQARIRPDDAVWNLTRGWVPQFDGWAIADHACEAIRRRLEAAPERLDIVETWTTSDHMWTRRAALVATLPWARYPNPKPAQLQARDRILGWAAAYVPDRDWFIQKAVGWWLRDLSKHDPDRVRAWLGAHGDGLKPFARKEAGRYLPDPESPA
ncbi:DNA alkylation repair protein [Chachezhania sediminis]|uniref:DNA alkylation repair protein n=1 Tax=Chachezhania sediminis TaxID=2599291 RepID=UPI00131D17E5|nr:DNA alkylation repair protein [Chachezhania sediminis]